MNLLGVYLEADGVLARADALVKMDVIEAAERELLAKVPRLEKVGNTMSCSCRVHRLEDLSGYISHRLGSFKSAKVAFMLFRDRMKFFGNLMVSMGTS